MFDWIVTSTDSASPLAVTRHQVCCAVPSRGCCPFLKSRHSAPGSFTISIAAPAFRANSSGRIGLACAAGSAHPHGDDLGQTSPVRSRSTRSRQPGHDLAGQCGDLLDSHAARSDNVDREAHTFALREARHDRTRILTRRRHRTPTLYAGDTR